MADGQSKWTLDLDIEKFAGNAIKAKGLISEIGDPESLAGLTTALMEAGTLVGVVGAAVLATKAAFDTVFETEQINNINAQFENLAKNAGVAGDVIKDKLVKAADGLAGDTEILKASNIEFLKLGANASKLPEIMELARKTTVAFGGDLISNYSKIADAIARGNARSLQSIGIKLDQSKAEQAYAAKLGITANALSQEEKQRATLEAVLARGEQALAGMNTETLKATQAWQQMKTAISESSETLTTAIGSVLRPVVIAYTTNLASMAVATKDWLKAHFGSDAEQAASKSQELAEQINQISIRISQAKGAAIEGGFWNKLMYGTDGAQKALDDLTKQRDALRSMRAELEKKAAPEKKPEAASSDVGGRDPAQDKQKRLAEELKFNQEVMKIKMQGLDAELAASAAYVDKDGTMRYRGEEIIGEKIKLLHKQADNDAAQVANSTEMTEAQKSQRIIAIHMKEAEEVKKLDNQVKDVREKNLQQYLKDSNSVSQGIQRGFRAGGQEAIKDMNNFGARGKAAFDSVNSHSKNFFMALGSGSQSASEAMRSAFFGVLGDMAEQQGAFLLASGIGTYNPIQIAEGGALLALAGYLQSQAGGGGSGGGASTGGGGGASAGSPPDMTQSADATSPTPQVAQKKTVSLNIQGNYFDTDQSRTRMMQMIRDAGDFTDFNLKKIGQA